MIPITCLFLAAMARQTNVELNSNSVALSRSKRFLLGSVTQQFYSRLCLCFMISQIMSFYLIFLCAICLPGIDFGVTADLGYKGYTLYEPGDMNIIVTAPHGGRRSPYRQANGARWPFRGSYGCKQQGKCIWTHSCSARHSDCKAATVNDYNTARIARDIADGIKEITGEGIYKGFSIYHLSDDGRHGPGSTPEKIEWGCCGPLPKTLTLFMTKICDFPYLIYVLTKNFISYL